MKTSIAIALLCLGLFSLSSCGKKYVDFDCEHELVIRPNGDYGKDALLFTERPTENFGQSIDNQVVAWTWYSHGFDGGAMRSIVEFDISALPSNASISSAKLTMYNNPNSSTCSGKHQSRSGSNAWQIERVVEPWGESTVTWNNQPKTSTSDVIRLPKSSSENQNYTIDLTDFVKHWYEKPSENNGILMRISTEQYYRSIIFASSDHPNADLHPKLVITYSK